MRGDVGSRNLNNEAPKSGTSTSYRPDDEPLTQQIADTHIWSKYSGTRTDLDGFSESSVPRIWSIDPFVWCFDTLLQTADSLGGPVRESTYTTCRYLASSTGEYSRAWRLVETLARKRPHMPMCGTDVEDCRNAA